MKKLLLALTLLTGCSATHRVVFDPWRGLDKAVAGQLSQGKIAYSKEQVSRTAMEVFENDAFIDRAMKDKSEISGMVDSRAWPSLKGTMHIWINNENGLLMTPYKPDHFQIDKWHDVKALFELGSDYFVSAIYRKLNDNSPVPFSLEELKGKQP